MKRSDYYWRGTLAAAALPKKRRLTRARIMSMNMHLHLLNDRQCGLLATVDNDTGRWWKIYGKIIDTDYRFRISTTFHLRQERPAQIGNHHDGTRQCLYREHPCPAYSHAAGTFPLR